ncbi:O-antigen ligase family protein [Tunturiibacter gelidoferens]|uniref:O-antigen ligase n=1 Tax=Tunturiibacter gelidiferens TaxID=3069689 RepID=A0ACC5NZ15_9BACT|nr:O-antigen ligase family protein [Edaphobacter lichenicola]MBB5339833.1 O-antigen ligase [Edaphobacter lichenicola]
MLGTGIGHYIPLVAYLGFCVMIIVSLVKRPLYGLYYMIPFLPYRTMRDHFLDYPLGGNMLTILVLAVIVGALIKGKRLPKGKGKLYLIWLIFAIYLYISMWLGVAMGNAPPPIWLQDINFVTWKDYMLIPLVFLAAGLVVEDRKSVKIIIFLTAFSVVAIDRSCLMDSMSRSWSNFDENKRGGGPLGFGSNQTAAYLAQFSMFFWGFAQFLKRKKLRLISYGIVALTIFTDMYTFSRGSYLAIILSVVVLGFLKDRKLLIVAALFLVTWQAIVPTAVRERVNMTENSNGQLESSANERVRLWQDAEDAIAADPIFGAGFATYQLTAHVDNLRDTHNWYIKVLVETGIVGMLIVLAMLQQMLAAAYRLFKIAEDPLYRGFGLGLFLAICACLVANCFGDRWTYIEITSPLWLLVGTTLRATEFSEAAPVTEATASNATISTNPFLAYR